MRRRKIQKYERVLRIPRVCQIHEPWIRWSTDIAGITGYSRGGYQLNQRESENHRQRVMGDSNVRTRVVLRCLPSAVCRPLPGNRVRSRDLKPKPEVGGQKEGQTLAGL